MSGASKVLRVALVLSMGLFAGCGGDDGASDAGSGKGGDDDASAAKDASKDGDGSTAQDGGSGSSGSGGGTFDAAIGPREDAGGTPQGCVAPAANQPYELLSCSGLYEDIGAKTLAAGVREFAPAVPLWSDGAEKTRWIQLPEGKKIDVSDPDGWKFPVGTKFWKEFQWEGKRVETRLFWKVSATFWARTAYRWNDDESEATRSGGEDVMLGSTNYHIPSTTECDQCHKGRVDRALGFEAISLGTAGATGVTLADLNGEGLLTGGTLPDTLEIGDDGTGKGKDALGWLHVNCGVSCHNSSSASDAYSTGLRLRVNVADADGSSTANIDARKTSIGIDAVTGRWLGQYRITAGDPSKSLLHKLMSTRNATNMKDQMPPIASRVAPTDAAKMISAWITAMP